MTQELKQAEPATDGVNHLVDNSLQITAETASKPRGPGRPFEPGQSGNPAGRPKGIRNRGTLLARALIGEEAENLVRTALDRALYKNDPVALRLCIDRILGPRRVEAVEMELPPLETAADATKALAAIAQAVTDGDLAPAEANHLSALVDRFVHALEAREFEARLAKLEEMDAEFARHV